MVVYLTSDQHNPPLHALRVLTATHTYITRDHKLSTTDWAAKDAGTNRNDDQWPPGTTTTYTMSNILRGTKDRREEWWLALPGTSWSLTTHTTKNTASNVDLGGSFGCSRRPATGVVMEAFNEKLAGGRVVVGLGFAGDG